MANNRDSLWWAAARGDEDLVRDLLGRQQKDFTFDVKAAKKAAFEHGHVHLMTVLDNNIVETALVILGHDNAIIGRNHHQHIQTLLEGIDFASLTIEEQDSLLAHTSILRNMRNLVNTWLSQIDPNLYVEEWGRILIQWGWGAEFKIWHAHHFSLVDPDEEHGYYLRAIESDQHEIWSSIAHWPTYHQTINMQYVNFQGPHILQHIWGSLQQHEKDTILNNAAVNGKTSIIEWALHHNLCDERQLISLMELALTHDEALVVEQLFEMISLPHKTTIIEQIKKHKPAESDDDDDDLMAKSADAPNPARDYFSDLVNIELGQDNEIEKFTQKQWRTIQQFKRIDRWIDQGNAALLAPWVDKLDQTQKNQALLKAARRGQVELVQLLLNEGAVDVLGNLLSHAASEGKTQVVQLLLNNEKYSSGAHSAMKEAIIKGHLDVVRLIGPHCDLNDGMALEAAVAYTQTNIVSFLLDQGAAPIGAYEEWARWMTFPIQEKNDCIISLLAPLIPNDPCNWNLFEEAIKAGMLHSARSLLNRFDHTAAPFHSLLQRLLSKGCADIRTLELILPFTTSGMGLVMAPTVAGNNWAVLDLLADQPVYNGTIHAEAIHECVQQNKINLLKRLMNNPRNHIWAASILFEAGKQNVPEIIDVLCEHHTFDEVEQAVKRLHVREYPKGKWNDLHLVKVYQKMCQRKEIEQATAQCGTETSKRRM